MSTESEKTKKAEEIISNSKGKLVMKISTIYVRKTKQYGETTLGQLTINGIAKSWFVLEPGGPDSTTAGSDKRIKAGRYKLVPYSSKRYPGVYELQNVPGRSKILIHVGNYHENTEGCLMPGKKWGVLADKHYYVRESKKALNEIFSEIVNSKLIYVVITNEFGR